MDAFSTWSPCMWAAVQCWVRWFFALVLIFTFSSNWSSEFSKIFGLALDKWGILIFNWFAMVEQLDEFKSGPNSSSVVTMKVKLLNICDSFRKLRSPLANIARWPLTNTNIADVCGRYALPGRSSSRLPLIAQNLLPPFNLTDDCNSRAFTTS